MLLGGIMEETKKPFLRLNKESVLVLAGVLMVVEILFPPVERIATSGAFSIFWGFCPIWEIHHNFTTKHFLLKVDTQLLAIELVVTAFLGFAVYQYMKAKNQS